MSDAAPEQRRNEEKEKKLLSIECFAGAGADECAHNAGGSVHERAAVAVIALPGATAKFSPAENSDHHSDPSSCRYRPLNL